MALEYLSASDGMRLAKEYLKDATPFLYNNLLKAIRARRRSSVLSPDSAKPANETPRLKDESLIDAQVTVSPIAAGESYKSEEVRRNFAILEIVELMDESNKNKDWLLDQIRQKRQRIQTRPDMGVVSILKLCPQELLENILSYLRGSEFDLDVVIPPVTKNYFWFFTDIVSASDPTSTTLDQARKIVLLNNLIEMSDTFKQRDRETTLILPTGDGNAIGFDDTPEKPLNLAIEIHKALNRYNKTRKKEDQVGLRIGLDSGLVYIMKDLNGNENVWGPGIINARRVMDLADKMNILASAAFANSLRMLKPEYRQIMHPIGDYQIKHGSKILIYNIYTQEIGNKKAPSPDKKQKSIAEQEVQKTIGRFLYSYIGIDIDIKDPLTMLAHHTMAWHLVNISDMPLERIFYFLDGDSNKSFQDMNVVIRDEEGQELEMTSLNVNRPLHKEFFVKLRRPMKPGEKGRQTIIEWDWEEPMRQFAYRFASDCKKFEFSLSAPVGTELNQKVVKIEETGDKFIATTAPQVKYQPDKIHVTWSSTDVHAHEVYRFDW